MWSSCDRRKTMIIINVQDPGVRYLGGGVNAVYVHAMSLLFHVLPTLCYTGMHIYTYIY